MLGVFFCARLPPLAKGRTFKHPRFFLCHSIPCANPIQNAHAWFAPPHLLSLPRPSIRYDDLAVLVGVDCSLKIIPPLSPESRLDVVDLILRFHLPPLHYNSLSQHSTFSFLIRTFHCKLFLWENAPFSLPGSHVDDSGDNFFAQEVRECDLIFAEASSPLWK